MADNEIPIGALTRRQAPEFLTRNGFPMSFSHFEKLCLLGKGPSPAFQWGKWLMYEPSTLLAWAKSRCKPLKSAYAA